MSHKYNKDFKLGVYMPMNFYDSLQTDYNVGDNYRNLGVQQKNRFDNYQPQFSYDNMSGVLDKLYTQVQNDISRNYGNEMNSATRDTGARLRSQGVTGGSMFNNAISGAQNNVLGAKGDAYSNLYNNRQNANVGLMDRANQSQFQTTQAAQGVDFQNIANELARLGGLGGYDINNRNTQMQENNQPGFWDDLLGLLNTGGKVAAAFA
jgi:hypothetical protein